MPADLGVLSIKMAGSLILILGLIIFLFYVLKRFRLGPLYQNSFPAMRILGTLNLAPKRAIALIEIYNQWLIVGIGTENVTLISKLDRPQEVCDTSNEIPTKGRKFHSIFQNLLLWQGDRKISNSRNNAET